MSEYFENYRESLICGKKNKNKDDEEIPEEVKSAISTYLCPPAGSSSNLGSKKQRLIFLEINRNDVYSILDAGKVADLCMMVMSASGADETLLKVDPEHNSGAIDALGYKALGLLRSQGTPSLIGVLQHVEKISSKKQSQIKRLFLRYFVSEFTDKHKFMCVNALTETQDINALLRQVAVTHPEPITWRDERTYMLGELISADKDKKEITLQGYIKNNFLNIKRLMHVTGVSA